jgi:hypothetical protein
MMTSLTIEMEMDYPKLYRFGYSSVNDIDTVKNWQTGNNRFTNVLNGRKYLFAVHLRDAFAATITSDILVSCNCGLMIYSVIKTQRADCQLQINSITKTLRLLAVTETDWSTGETIAQDDETEPDWISGETTAQTAQSDVPEIEWTDGETTECSLKINGVTKILR